MGLQNKETSKLARNRNNSKNNANKGTVRPTVPNQSHKEAKCIAKNKLTCLYVNARSIRNKKNEILALIETENRDIVAFTETWLNNDIDFVDEYKLEGYNLLNKNREHKKGGGILLYVNNNINIVRVDEDKNESYDLLVIEIYLNKNERLTFGTVYRPPNQTEQNDIQMLEDINATIKNQGTILVGDFNYPGINWNQHTSDTEGEKLLNFIDDKFYSQKVDKPTRGNNFLDLVICSDEDLIGKLEVGDKFSTSDHHIIRFEINTTLQRNANNDLIPDYKRANFANLRNEIKAINWDLMLENKNINEMWSTFKAILENGIAADIPFKKRRTGLKKNSWMTKELMTEIGKRDKLYKKSKMNTNTNVDEQLFKIQRRKCKKLLRTTVREYEKGIAQRCKENPREFFGYVGKRKKVKTSIGPLTDHEGNHLVADKEMAGHLNNYFKTVFLNKETSKVPAPEIITVNNVRDKLMCINITKPALLSKLNKLNVTKSHGPDNIYPRVIKEIKDEIAYPIVKLFNKSIQEGVVPQDWKDANVSPIFKKGSKSKAENYRPISLTSILCRLLENCIRDVLVDHLEANNLIHETQHGFRKQKSCLTNLLEFFDKVIKLSDAKKPVDIIYLDFAKAFDRVSHPRLISKVKNCSIDGSLLMWIENWLTDRRQRVVLNGECSDWVEVTSGVPQGSVLGPILFTIYINDIDTGLKSSIVKFADDTKLMAKVENTTDWMNLQNDLKLLELWNEQWDMKFNENKCKVMHIGKNNSNYNYMLKNKTMDITIKEKDLGITISNDLKFSDQCNIAYNKANKILGMVSRNFSYKTKETVKLLYTSMVRPHLEYAVQFWSPHYQKDIEKLERVQHRATKMIPEIRSKPYSERLKDLDLYSLEKRRARGDMIQTYKILKGFDKVDTESMFKLDHESNTRGHHLKLKKRSVNLDIGKYTFANRVVNDWNTLTPKVVNSPSINSFKKNIDLYYKEINFL